VEVHVLDSRFVVRSLLCWVAALTLAAPASATTLVRRGLERLTLDSETIVEASVLDLHSYWNADHSFILTDIRARPSRVLKGDPATEVVFTVMGGTVGDRTVLVVGGPDIAPGSRFVLFLGRTDLPGAPGRLTVRDLSQGVFVIERGRAFSQAMHEPLLPDADGLFEVPGGEAGLPLEELALRVREIR
jgi:hypothetical protein